VQQPPYPATTPAIRSCRPERSLTAFARGVSGAAPLPAFPMPGRAVAGNPKEVCSPLRARRQQNRSRSGWPEDSRSSCHTEPNERKRSSWFDGTRVKSPSPPTFNRYSRIHFTGTQKPSIRELNSLRVTEKIELTAAEIADEAGATPPFAARCVTGSVGSLPPHQFTEYSRSLLRSIGRSAIFITRFEEYMVNGVRSMRFTLAFTDPFTLKVSETTCTTEVMNSIWTRGKHRAGLERPHFWPKAFGQKTVRVAPAHHAYRENVLSPRPRVGPI